MNVGGGLGSEGMLSSLLRVWAYRRVSGYHSVEKKEAQGFQISLVTLFGSVHSDIFRDKILHSMWA